LAEIAGFSNNEAPGKRGHGYKRLCDLPITVSPREITQGQPKIWRLAFLHLHLKTDSAIWILIDRIKAVLSNDPVDIRVLIFLGCSKIITSRQILPECQSPRGCGGHRNVYGISGIQRTAAILSTDLQLPDSWFSTVLSAVAMGLNRKI
jgi:hypothetical protein